MIINPFALVAGAASLIQCGLGIFVAALGWTLWRRSRSLEDPEQRTAVESRSYLLFLTASVLAVVNIASWPLLYLVLQSYVPEWPGVMCIYGVTRVGLGSDGPSGILPALLGALQALKPAIVFLMGGWLVIYAFHRRSRTAWLLRPLVAVAAVAGLAATLDASAGAAYLTIPKKNAALSSGCCPVPDRFTQVLADHARGVPATDAPAGPAAAYFGTSALAVAALIAARRGGLAARLAPVAGLGAFWAGVSLVRDVVGPHALGLPLHRCLFDLVEGAPLLAAALSLLAWGTLCAGWTFIAGWLKDRISRQEDEGPDVRAMPAGIAAQGAVAFLSAAALIAAVWVA